MQKPIISLFSGAMGLDLGIESAGGNLKTAVVVEINKTAVETIRLNRPKARIFNKSIHLVGTDELLQEAQIKPGEAFLVTGGPCCQSFSTVGKRASLGDEMRGGLFRHFKRVVEEARPRFFVMENVKGILSAAIRHRPLKERGPDCAPLSQEEELGSAFKRICEELIELNYYVVFGLLNCADYGVPQKRFRVVIIGSRDGEAISLPKPTHVQYPTNGKPKWQSLRDSIGELKENDPEFLQFTEKKLAFLGLLKAGQNWKNLPLHMQKEALGAAYDSWGGRVGFCRRLEWKKPAPTLTTSPNGRATTLCHPTKLRPLSVLEYATLQQFPVSWKFVGATTQKYIQIGNAVPIGLGRAIGKMLLRTFEETHENGLPEDAALRLGRLVCEDVMLEKRIKNRARTELNPPHLRKNSDLSATRKWMKQVA